MVSFHQGSCDDQPLFSETGADQREESTHETHQGGGAGFEKAKEHRWNDIPSGSLAIEHGDIVTMVDLPMKGDGFQSFLYVYQILKNDMGFILIHNMGINHSQLPQSLDGFGGRAHRIGM